LKIDAPAASKETCCPGLQAKYTVSDDILGQGTTAVVKRGTSKEKGHAVAIKEIKTYGDDELANIMRKEFTLMQSLRHPNIVQVYDFYIATNVSKAFICMQLVEGESLESCICKQGKIDEDTMRPLFEQVCTALGFLHCKRIIHRDLKPDNILVTHDMEKVLLCDFNTARQLADGCCLTNRVGTQLYAAPEMLLGLGLLGEQADIWSLGMCLYFALSGGYTVATGKSFAGNNAFGEYLLNAASAERQEWIKSAGIPKESPVAQVLWACLHPDAAERPDTRLLLAHPWLAHDIPPILRTKSTPKTMCHKPRRLRLTDSENATARSQRLCSRGLDMMDSDIDQRSAKSIDVNDVFEPETPNLWHGKGVSFHTCVDSGFHSLDMSECCDFSEFSTAPSSSRSEERPCADPVTSTWPDNFGYLKIVGA
jgi:serine/threonine protein kinase